ncbi:uncharacterized protein LOC143913453 [Arctopsyche grandis]|uniref:uncharacterized protein LOC143913453 n=1 Tax=Arctopsyche grandis TaxID=121162 RepID=UPI00406D77FD
MAEEDSVVRLEDLPITFQVKYLGSQNAGGLWGIKHTRKPVDNMVNDAKNLPPSQILPIVKLTVSTAGVQINSIGSHKKESVRTQNTFKIESISYGVQDLIYTRVFSMIIVRDAEAVKNQIPFECHAFVCDSKNAARKLTYALAAAFQEYSERVKQSQADSADGDGETPRPMNVKKKFAIDLRTSEEIEADMNAETEA